MFIYEDMIQKEVCKNLITFYEKSPDKTFIKEPYTQMSVLFLDKLNPNLFGYHVELNKVIAKYKKKYKYIDKGQEPWTIFSNIKIQKYNPGESYVDWHTESTGYDGNQNRVLVFTTYLNNVKEGGETEFFYQKEKIKPKEGLTLLFPPFWPHTHKGNPSQETKYIITGWYTYVH